MSVGYVAVQWNRHKRVYDAVMAGGVLLFLAVFVAGGRWLHRGEYALADEVLAIRALGACALTMLHVALAIGPLARLDRRFLVLLYNRRHLGVCTFLVGLAHGLLAIGYYHGFGVLNPLASLLAVNTDFTSLRAFPFQILGLSALIILFLMAATSHDFWLKNLGSVAWKWLHMLVYAAYLLLFAHVALGALQADRGWSAAAALALGLAVLAALHVAAGVRDLRREAPSPPATEEGWLDAGDALDIPEDRARIIGTPGGVRIAVFRHAGRVSAVANVCAHQGGPVGEGRVVNGCITCPWHGWQYRAADGCSPPPFTERLPTHAVRIAAGRVHVKAVPEPLHSPASPAAIDGSDA